MTKVFFAFLIASIIWDFWNWNSLDRWTIEHTFIMIATDLGYWCNLTVAPTKLCELRIHKYIQEKWGWISIDSMFTNGHWKSCNVFCWEEKQTTANVTQCIKLYGGYTAGLRLNEEQGHWGQVSRLYCYHLIIKQAKLQNHLIQCFSWGSWLGQDDTFGQKYKLEFSEMCPRFVLGKICQKYYFIWQYSSMLSVCLYYDVQFHLSSLLS